MVVPNVEGGQRAGSLTEQSQVVGHGRVLVIMREDSDISNMYSSSCNGLDIHDIKVGRYITFADYSARFVVQRAGVIAEEKTCAVLCEI
jgi:hypothetical protein